MILDDSPKNIYTDVVKTSRQVTLLEQATARMTERIGSPSSLVIHTAAFIVAFSLPFFGVSFDRMLLVVTTLVSLEAIYLAIFIQMTVNRHSAPMEEVSEDVDDIQENVEEISKDIDDIQEDVEDLSEEITKGDEAKKGQHHDAALGQPIDRIEHALEELLREVRVLRGRM